MFQVQTSKSGFEMAISETTMKLAQAKRDLESARAANPLSPTTIVRLRTEVGNYERGLAILNEEFSTLFPA